MPDDVLLAKLIGLADAIRDIPTSDVHQAVVDRFFQVVAHLGSTGALPPDQMWNLKSRR